MADDLSYAGPRDPSRIDIHGSVEAAWRCKEWACTVEEPKVAIACIQA
jgi:hypothetical protein